MLVSALLTSCASAAVFPRGVKLVNNIAKKTDDAPRTSVKGNLKYYGGPVIPNVNVVPILYGGDKVEYQKEIQQFYSGIVKSSVFDWLSEYNTPSQKIGRGTSSSAVSVTSGLKTTLDDASDIQPLLVSLVKSGKIKPDANTYYPIHFQPGVYITMGGQGSCEVFCAYHGTIDLGNNNLLYYGVLPDQGGNCANGCGNALNRFDNLCSVASHELIEAVTDPAVGLAQEIAKPLAWYDETNGEIGDICNADQGRVKGGDGVTYTIQTEWSNKAKKCRV